MTDADRSPGGGFGFARTPTPGRRPPQAKNKPASNKSTSFEGAFTERKAQPNVTGLKRTQDRPTQDRSAQASSAPTSLAQDEKQPAWLKTSPGPKEGEPEVSLMSDETSAAPSGLGRKLMLLVALGLAGLTYILAVTGFLSLLKSF